MQGSPCGKVDCTLVSVGVGGTGVSVAGGGVGIGAAVGCSACCFAFLQSSSESANVPSPQGTYAGPVVGADCVTCALGDAPRLPVTQLKMAAKPTAARTKSASPTTIAPPTRPDTPAPLLMSTPPRARCRKTRQAAPAPSQISPCSVAAMVVRERGFCQLISRWNFPFHSGDHHPDSRLSLGAIPAFLTCLQSAMTRYLRLACEVALAFFGHSRHSPRAAPPAVSMAHRSFAHTAAARLSGIPI